jgi:integrase
MTPAEARGWVRDARVAVRRDRQLVRAVPALEQAGEAGSSRRGPAWSVRAVGSVKSQRRCAGMNGGCDCVRTRHLGPSRSTRSVAPTSRNSWTALVGDGLAATTIETTINAIRAVYRHELARDRLKTNPTRGVTLASGGGRRERFATPVEAKALLAALRVEDRAVWATAFYAGLRRGELMALRDQAVDIKAGEIRVVAGWDEVAGEQETKGRERRAVPIIGELSMILAAHRRAGFRLARAVSTAGGPAQSRWDGGADCSATAARPGGLPHHRQRGLSPASASTGAQPCAHVAIEGVPPGGGVAGVGLVFPFFRGSL